MAAPARRLRHGRVSDIRAASPSVDLSRLPAPLVVQPLAYEATLQELIAGFRARYPEFDALVESDPALKLLEIQAEREVLARGAINDAARSLMLAFAAGADLDHLAADDGVQRHVVTPATPNAPAVMESDGEFRRRILLAADARAGAGPRGAWIFHALSADPRVLNADVWSPEAGHVTVAVQSREGDGSASAELVEAVRSRLARPDIKPLTDVLSVRSVENVPYTIAVEGFILPGPAPALIRQEMIASIAAMAIARRTPDRDVPRSAIFAAASIGPVDKVLVTSPAADIARGPGEVGVCVGVDVKVTAYGG